MFDWSLFLDEDEIAGLLSGKYAQFARPVREGLILFLSSLPQSHQEEILVQQAALPPLASNSQRLAWLARSCPVLHKLGQILARDRRLAPEFRRHLHELESMAPVVPEKVIREILDQELGSLDRLGLQLQPPALAEASVAVVIPFVAAREGGGGERLNGVFKVLKPGIEDRLGLELEMMGRVGMHLDLQNCAAFGIPHLEYEEVFRQIRDKLSQEVRLDEEQRHLTQAAACYANEPEVHIPELLEYCTPRVTAMERITGGKITDHGRSDRYERRYWAAAVARALVVHPILSSARALFHSDPHAGNLFLTTENRLAILDWSLVGTLGETERAAMAQIMLAALTLDAARMTGILAELHQDGRADVAALKGVVEGWLKQIRQGMRPGLVWLTGLLDDAVQTAGLRVAADLLLFRKSLHTLEGVTVDICGDATLIDDVLLTEFLCEFAREWPRRWLAAPHSRTFGTRVSNLDIARTLFDVPAAVARYWTGQSGDWMDDCRAMRNNAGCR